MATVVKKNLITNFLKAMGNDKASIASNGTIFDSETYISTGCYLLNGLISGSIYRGIPNNRSLMFAGLEGTGKTYVVLNACKAFLNDYENGIIIYFESEGAVNKEILETRGIDTTRFVLVPVSNVEDLTVQATKVLKEFEDTPKEDRPPMAIFLDSLGMLASQKEISNTENDDIKQDFTRNKQIKSFFRIITSRMSQLSIPLIFTNHVYNSMNQYDPYEVSGGTGMKYACSFIVMLSKSSYKDDEKNHIGITVKARTLKSRKTRAKESVDFNIHFEKGISVYSGLFDFCYEEKLIVKKGTRYHWHTEDETTAKTKKAILKDLAEFFNKTKLDELDKFCGEKFLLGRNNENIEAEAELLDDESED